MLRLDNPSQEPEAIEALNHFFTRLIFCYYAEDTNIFEKDIFTQHIETYTEYDGTNVDTELDKIFDVLNKSKRDDITKQYNTFPYVNGGLFKGKYNLPKFSPRARRLLIECGKIDWCHINPDIFGAMFQGVMDPEIRHELGAHYTSVTNIMKVINPLFMDDLRKEFEKCKGSEKKLQALQHRISEIKIFDPACGSGNFLITAYKELRNLEMDILEEMSLASHEKGNKKAGTHFSCFSLITVNSFYGIELNPFAVELAKLSMWLAEHQVNIKFQGKFGVATPMLPLRNSAQIVAANACRINWEEVCPKGEKDEIYILGNPPYIGSTWQSAEQKSDLSFNLKSDFKNYKNLDYISCWFYKGALYIQEYIISLAFVTTHSICQGEHVPLLWKQMCHLTEIHFAYVSFKWTNSAVNKAGVSCNIVGLINKRSGSNCYIYTEHGRKSVNNINPYLIEG